MSEGEAPGRFAGRAPAPGRRNTLAFEAVWNDGGRREQVAAVLALTGRTVARVQLRCGKHASGATVFLDPSAPVLWMGALSVEPHKAAGEWTTGGTIAGLIGEHGIEGFTITCQTCGKEHQRTPLQLLDAALESMRRSSTGGWRAPLK